MRFLHMPHPLGKRVHRLGFPISCFLHAQFDEKGANRFLHFQTSAISTLVIKRTEVPTLVFATLWLNGLVGLVVWRQ